MAGAKGTQPRDGPQKRGLTRPVRAQQSHHLSLLNGDGHVEVQGSESEADGGIKAHAEPSQRSLRPTKTTNETSRRTRLRMKEDSGLVSRRRYTANGTVWVTPGRLPANVIVAPNSPSARAQHKTEPAKTDGPISGSVTRVNTLQRLAPNARAASS